MAVTRGPNRIPPGGERRHLEFDVGLQQRGECGPRQVPGTKLSLVNGMGGMLSAAGTLVLSHER